MLTFTDRNNSSTLSNDATNPEKNHIHQQLSKNHRSQEINGNSNEAQTPHFVCFQSQKTSESVFDAYHNTFSGKMNSLNKLISTFEDLGLDIEYVEESEASQQQDFMMDGLKELQRIKKTCSSPQKVYIYDHDQNTVSSLYQIKITPPIKCRLQNIKTICKTAREDISQLLSFLSNFRRDCDHIFLEAKTSLTNYLTTFVTNFQHFIRKNESDRASNLFCSNFRKDNDQLQNIFTLKDEKIRKLSKEKEELEMANKEFQEKIGCLEIEMKELRKQLQSLSYDNKITKIQLEKKYQNMFQAAIQAYNNKIKLQNFGFKEEYEQRMERRLNKAKTQPFMSLEESNFHLKHSKTQKNQSLYAEQSHERPVPFRITYSSPQNHRSKYTGYDSHFDERSIHQQKSIEHNERQANKILNDIRMMKGSRFGTSTASSMYIDQSIRLMK